MRNWSCVTPHHRIPETINTRANLISVDLTNPSPSCKLCIPINVNLLHFCFLSLSLSELPPLAAAQLSCQLSARDLSTTISTMDTATLTLDPESCPYCAKAMSNESEGGTEGNETPGDSDSDGVYEFTQDLRHRDRRNSRQPKKKRLRLGKTAATIVRFWRLVCDTFRKIVDSKYFGRGIMIAILINTLSMGIEYHEQVSWYLFFHVLYKKCRVTKF